MLQDRQRLSAPSSTVTRLCQSLMIGPLRAGAAPYYGRTHKIVCGIEQMQFFAAAALLLYSIPFNAVIHTAAQHRDTACECMIPIVIMRNLGRRSLLLCDLNLLVW